MNADIQDYYKGVKDKYPDVDIKQFADICNTLFKMTREIMTEGSFKDIRLKHIGKFQISPFRVKKSIGSLDKKLRTGKITKEEYNEEIIRYKDYIKDEEISN